MAKKKEPVFSGERIPENFIIAVAGAIEGGFGKVCEPYPDLKNPEGVSVEDVRVAVGIEFRAGRPYVVIDGERIVNGLSDLDAAVRKAATAAYHALPKMRKRQETARAVQAQNDRLVYINNRLEMPCPSVRVSDSYERVGDLKKLRIHFNGTSSSPGVTDLSDEQLERLCELAWRWNALLSEAQQFLDSLGAGEGE